MPKFPPVFLYILIFTLFFIVFNSYYHNVPLYTYENVRRFLFWGAAIFFLNLFYSETEERFEKFEHVIVLALTIFVGCSLLEFFLYPNFPPYFTFGNINLASEYVTFSMVFLLGRLTRIWQKLQTSFFLNFASALSISYVYLTSSRSTYIAIILMNFLFTVLNIRQKKEIIKIIIMALIFIGLIVLIKYLYPSPSPDLALLKDFSFRWALYINTLKMLVDIPFGVGIGQYEFASLPFLGDLFPEFNERKIFHSPHNEFLRYLSEDGVILSLLFFFLGSSLIYTFWKKIRKAFQEHTIFLYFSIVLFVQSLFQFPLLEPYPYYLTSLLIGYFFSVAKIDVKIYVLSGLSKTIFFTFNIIALTVIIFYFSFQYVSLHLSKDEMLNKFACHAGRNWLACLNVSSYSLHQSNLDQAERYTRKTLEWQPLNFQGMKSLGFIHLYQGERRKACKLFKEFNSFFQDQSSLKNVISYECILSPRVH
ncbi:MAG: O-antigen ligase family protein [Alphaproteobacteria bacterium]|nr:O-antigen ligase family protein [Alphaproteobacteria bacterium]